MTGLIQAFADIFRGMEVGIRAGVWWNIALLAGTLTAMPFDRRVILGLNPWIKPLKFEISVIIFLLTVGLLLHLLKNNGASARTLMLLGWGFGIAMIVENSLIAMQSARGVRSHMNFTTLFDGVTFGIMGVFILINTVLLVAVLVMFSTNRIERPPAELWGIRLGLAMLLAASIEGVRIVMNNGHTVGAHDGGPGLPLLNWSTQHGDLRVAHFFGLHALQLLWLTGWLLARTNLSQRTATGILLLVTVVYAGFTWMLFSNAMAGHALIARR